MKKLLILSLVLTKLLFSEDLTFFEQKELISLLENQIKSNPKNGAFELGLIYEDGILNSDNKKIPNIELATKYYIMAFENKDYRSVFKIVSLLLQNNAVKDALNVLKEVIENSSFNKSLLISSITTYGTITLDYFENDKDMIANALYYYTFLSNDDINEVPTSKFIKSILLASVGNISEGEKLLNEACYSTNAPDELKEKCFNNDNFDFEDINFKKEDINVKKSVNEPCCNILEQH